VGVPIKGIEQLSKTSCGKAQVREPGLPVVPQSNLPDAADLQRDFIFIDFFKTMD
jgi:hypothetical protein